MGDTLNINTIKKYISDNIGKNVQIVVYGMRNKRETYVGKIHSCYPNIFAIKMDVGEKTFPYVDVCTGDIKIKYLN